LHVSKSDVLLYRNTLSVHRVAVVGDFFLHLKARGFSRCLLLEFGSVELKLLGRDHCILCDLLRVKL
jgi:hypothetical protein